MLTYYASYCLAHKEAVPRAIPAACLNIELY